MTLDQEVKTLIIRGFISSAFQPIVNLNTGRMVAFEALMRGPGGTPLARPDVIFGPRSTLSSGMIQQLDAACVAAALRSGRLLVSSGDLFVNLHISTLLKMPSLQDHFLKLLDSSGIEPKSVVIEISERTTVDRPRAISRILGGFRRRGFRFAIDDFGMAYSGLNHLYWFEPEYTKLDRAFIRNLDRSQRRLDLVGSTASMCEKMGSTVVAEGVETTGELMAVMSLNLTLAQGFHFGRPKASTFWVSEDAVTAVYKPWFSAVQLTSLSDSS